MSEAARSLLQCVLMQDCNGSVALAAGQYADALNALLSAPQPAPNIPQVGCSHALTCSLLRSLFPLLQLMYAQKASVRAASMVTVTCCLHAN